MADVTGWPDEWPDDSAAEWAVRDAPEGLTLYREGAFVLAEQDRPRRDLWSRILRRLRIRDRREPRFVIASSADEGHRVWLDGPMLGPS